MPIAIVLNAGTLETKNSYFFQRLDGEHMAFEVCLGSSKGQWVARREDFAFMLSRQLDDELASPSYKYVKYYGASPELYLSEFA